MKHIQSLEDFIAENPQHEEIIRRAIKVNDDFKSFMYSNICGICNNLLTINEFVNVAPFDFTPTCFEHKEFAGYYQIDRVRDQLKLTPEILKENFDKAIVDFNKRNS